MTTINSAIHWQILSANFSTFSLHSLSSLFRLFDILLGTNQPTYCSTCYPFLIQNRKMMKKKNISKCKLSKMIPIYFKLELIVFCLFEFFSISLGQVDDKANSVCFLQSSLFEHVYSDSIQNIHTVHSCCSNSSNFSVVYLLSCRKWKIR